MPARILITTTVDWPFAARLAAAFADLSSTVEALAPRTHVLGASRHVSVLHQYDALLPLRSLKSAISKAKPDLIVPCDDRALSQMLKLWRRCGQGRSAIAAVIASSLGDPERYARLLSRPDFIADARADGILAPEMRDAKTEEDLEEGLRALGTPVALKADGTWGGHGVVLAKGREDARAAWHKLSRTSSPLRSLYRAFKRRDPHHVGEALHPTKPHVGLQAFVQGRPATSTMACWRGEVLAALHFDVVTTADTTGPATVLRRIADAAMDAAARSVVRRYGLSGLHGLDYVRDPTGRAQLLEINPRATPTSHLAFGEAGDLIAPLVSAVLGRTLRSRPAVSAQNTIALFPQEWMRDPKSMYLRSAYHDVPWDDRMLLRALVGKEEAETLVVRNRVATVAEACEPAVVSAAVLPLGRAQT